MLKYIIRSVLIIYFVYAIVSYLYLFIFKKKQIVASFKEIVNFKVGAGGVSIILCMVVSLALNVGLADSITMVILYVMGLSFALAFILTKNLIFENRIVRIGLRPVYFSQVQSFKFVKNEDETLLILFNIKSKEHHYGIDPKDTALVKAVLERYIPYEE